jgi:hypothetical protein
VEIQAVIAYCISALLLVLSGYFGWQQLRSLSLLRTETDLSAEDRSYLRNQVRLRLTCCALMVGLAIMVAGTHLSGLERQVADLAQKVQGQRQRGEEVVLDPEQQRLGKLFGYYWIVVLLLLLLIVVLAGFDLWSIRRYGRRHLRQIQIDRRAMVEQQVSRLRTQRNGHGGSAPAGPLLPPPPADDPE